MRATYRSHNGNHTYWKNRWTRTPADTGRLNLDKYPGKYAERVIAPAQGPVLEAGCGAGRVLMHYHGLGKPIIGIDFIEEAIVKIKRVDARIDARVGDITRLEFETGTFDAVVAFGLYHNLERDIDAAVIETRRVLKKSGKLCASVRLDNIQNRVIDFINGRERNGERVFHKMNFKTHEFVGILQQSGFKVTSIDYVENMSFLYKIKAFRHASQTKFDERSARGEGYRLSAFGSALQRLLVTISPKSFSNIVVVTAEAV